jgi:shikimate kinase/3-dehydroquinate synthase
VRRQAKCDGDAAERPLLAGDAAAKLGAMLAERAPLYAAADVTLDTDARCLEDVCDAAIDAIEQRARAGGVPLVSLSGSTERSDIYVGRRALDVAPEIVRQRWPRTRVIWLISDTHVASTWGDVVCAAFEDSAFDVRLLLVEPGEATKRIAEVERLCDLMTRGGATRGDLVVAFGGGVVGDLAGFVAAICLRGLALLQLPTSLLAMVDSSVGGKTGVNLPAGKNLAGAFYQPGVVVIDSRFLDTLPRPEYRSGMAEIVKHGLIQPATPFGGTDLLDVLAAASLDPLPPEAVDDVLRLNVRIKHSVVQADERESGLRMLLNFGHTAGHAIEADGYRYRHGEAVGLGLIVAARLAGLLGRVDDAYVVRVEHLISRAGLPIRVEGAVDAIVNRMAHDKKNVDGALNWILPDSSGWVERVTGVPVELVRTALRDIGAT